MEANNYLKADFLDIVFEGKNKAYGAYTLRRHYERRLSRAIIGTIGLLILLVGIIAVIKYARAHQPVTVKEVSRDVVLQNVAVQQPDLPPPPPPPPAPELPKLHASVAYTPPQVVEDKWVRPEEEPPDLSRLEDIAIGTETRAGDLTIDPGLITESGEGVTQAPKADPEKVFIAVEQMPSFPGGMAALNQYLSSHIHYPPVARQHGIQGTVVIRFVVNTDGSIVQVVPVGAKLGGGLEEEAVRVVQAMPAWIPGKQNGRAVRVAFHLPIQFRLQ